MMDASSTDGNPTWCFPFSQTEWDQTPGAVQAHVLTLHTQLHALQQQHHQLQQQVDTLQGRLNTTSKTSSKPPSSDSPFTKPTRRPSSGKRGARKGHPGSGTTLLEPTDLQHVYPAPCACGHGALGTPTLYHTHQVIELPPIDDGHHPLPVAPSPLCGVWRRGSKPTSPAHIATGYGPRLTALIGELGGMHRTSRRLVQDFCHSVLHIPMSLGAVQKVIDRASQAIVPHYEAIATLARQATVGYIDETPWYCQNTLQWLWTMATETVSLYLIHPHRSKDAFFALIEDWQGILVSDGYGVYQDWVNQRQTCLAHLIRTRPRVVGKTRPGPCGLWDVGTQGVAALVSYGHGAAHGWRVAGVVCAVVHLD